jgi:hypothetical protein
MTPISREEARAAGLKRYFTGVPCAHGHVAEREVSGCRCVECGRATGKTYYWQHRDQRRAASRAWFKANPEKRAEWRSRNPEKVKASQRRYFGKNRESRLAALARWRAANPERVRATMKAWRAGQRRGSENAADANPEMPL